MKVAHLLTGALWTACLIAAAPLGHVIATPRATLISINYYGSHSPSEPVKVYRGVTANLIVRGLSVTTTQTVTVTRSDGGAPTGITTSIVARTSAPRPEITLAFMTTASTVPGQYRVRLTYPPRTVDPDEFLVQVVKIGSISGFTAANGTTGLVVGGSYSFTATGSGLEDAQLSAAMLGPNVSSVSVTMRTSTAVAFSIVPSKFDASITVRPDQFFDRGLSPAPTTTGPWSFSGSTTLGLRTAPDVLPTVNSMTLSAGRVIGSAPVTATLALSGVNPATALTMNLTSNDTTTAPSVAGIRPTTPSVAVALATRPVFDRVHVVTFSVGGKTANLTVDPYQPGTLTAPSSVTGGQTVSASIELNGTLPSTSNLAVSLRSSDTTALSVPPQVVVTGRSAAFSVVARPISFQRAVTITASTVVKTLTASVTVLPVPVALLDVGFATDAAGSAPPVTMNAGESRQMVVRLTTPAQAAGGETIHLAPNDAAALMVPPTVTIPAGQAQATFMVIADTIPANVTALITATRGSEQRTRAVSILRPAFPTALQYSIGTFNTNTFTGKVTIERAAPPGGQTVWFSALPTAPLTLPYSVVVPAGQTTATFPVTTTLPGGITTVRHLGTTASVEYHVPNVAGAPSGNFGTKVTLSPLGNAFTAVERLATVELLPYVFEITHSVSTDNPATGTITFNRPAPAGGATIQLALTANASGRVTVPPIVTMSPGATSVTYPITVLQANGARGVTFIALYLGATGAYTVP